MEEAGRRSKGRPERRFMDAGKEDKELVGVREEDGGGKVGRKQITGCSRQELN